MTGRYNVRNYINFGTLLRSETTFGTLFKNAGYATAVCGKWQLGREVDSPQHFGFDESLLWQHTRRPPRYANAGLELNGVEKQYPEGSYGPKVINDFALDFISRNKAKPFFLYYPFMLTHNPFQPTPDSPDWDPKTNSEKAQQDDKHFADMVAYMDKMIGVLDARLRAATANPQVQELLRAQGIPDLIVGDAFRRKIAAESAALSAIAREVGIRPQ